MSYRGDMGDMGDMGDRGDIIVGKSDFASGILILESIFPNFSEYFS